MSKVDYQNKVLPSFFLPGNRNKVNFLNYSNLCFSCSDIHFSNSKIRQSALHEDTFTLPKSIFTENKYYCWENSSLTASSLRPLNYVFFTVWEIHELLLHKRERALLDIINPLELRPELPPRLLPRDRTACGSVRSVRLDGSRGARAPPLGPNHYLMTEICTHYGASAVS